MNYSEPIENQEITAYFGESTSNSVPCGYYFGQYNLPENYLL